MEDNPLADQLRFAYGQLVKTTETVCPRPSSTRYQPGLSQSFSTQLLMRALAGDVTDIDGPQIDSQLLARQVRAPEDVFPNSPIPEIKEPDSAADKWALALQNPTKVRKVRPKAKEHAPWKLKRVLIGHQGWVRCASFDPSNSFFATGSTDATIKFWDLASGTLNITLTGHMSPIRAIEISRIHPYLFSCSEDKTIRCWDLNTNKSIRIFGGHLSGVYTLSLHPKHNIFASGGRDSVVRVWDIRTRHQVLSLEGHTDIVNSVAMQSDEPQLLSASTDATVRLWDIVAGKSYSVLTNHKKGIRALRLHPVEYTFVTASQDNLKLWKGPEGTFLRNFEKSNGELIHCLDTDGTDLLVSGSDTGKIRFYDWGSGEVVQTIETPNQPGSLEGEVSVFDLKFDMSGKRLVSCECDKTVKIWQQETTA